MRLTNSVGGGILSVFGGQYGSHFGETNPKPQTLNPQP